MAYNAKVNKDQTPATHVGAAGDHVAAGIAGSVLGAGVGVGVASAAGAITGSVAGPMGTVAGAVIGAVGGALAGKGIASTINPTTEDVYWRGVFNENTPTYVTPNTAYETYQPAYRYGVDSYSKYEGRHFDEIEQDLSRDWNTVRGESTLEWDKARPATRDAYERLYNPNKTQA